MKHLKALRKYFYKYRLRLTLGIVFVTLSNIFAVLSPVVIRNTIDQVYDNITVYHLISDSNLKSDFVRYITHIVMLNALLLLAFAIIRGIFMFFMRQTIIVMSRHIEYDQKNEIFQQYQRLNTSFFKQNSTGDLMSRISEDVSRVRMYTGPAIMYTINLSVLIIMSIWGMLRVSPSLTLYVLLPLPILAFTMYKINTIINKKSEKIQAQLGKLTTYAQEGYSGIRVIKSFVQENNMQERFSEESELYKNSNLGLAKVEAFYTPAMGLFIGISTLLTIYLGGLQAICGDITTGNIAEFIIYITMLTFPVSALGWTTSMIQRAAASQKRLNEFLDIKPDIVNPASGYKGEINGNIVFENVTFTYPHTGITALKDFSMTIKQGQKVAILGKTGSGKSTIAHLLLRMYDATKGAIMLNNVNIKKWDLDSLREQISYVPQDVFLFSDTIRNNIGFGVENESVSATEDAAKIADVHKDIEQLKAKYETVVGERGVMLSGGQKQRVSIARALIKQPKLFIMDDSISAVDTKTEQNILEKMKGLLQNKTAIIITHRIFKTWDFDQIIVLENGMIKEAGTHDELIKKQGYYFELFTYQSAE